ncbi:MAG: efflux RND transporter periplasmic adaptor subunit [Sediminibacterium sp.]
MIIKIISITMIVLLLFACDDKKQSVDNKDMSDMKMSAHSADEDTTNKNENEGMGNMLGMGNDSATDKMDLKTEPGTGAKAIKLSDQQVQLGNIMTDTINSSMRGDKIILTATLNIDQMKTTSISARVMGRIEKLYFKNIGDYVKKGDRLFDLYSEELNNGKQELRLALERQNTLDNSIIDFNQLIQSAKYKLLLWGMSEAQIQELITTKKTIPTTTFFSNVSGYITMLELKEGDYTMEGSTVMRLADLSTVWAEAQVYSSQLSQIERNGNAEVQIPDIPGKKVNGKIEFVNPEINPDTRINLVRVSIPNPGNQLKPGMSAYVILKSRQHSMLSLPIDAVLRDGKGATVWIQTAKNTYQSRMVVLGMETGDRIEIKSGLKAGDIVVISGAYLINSEYIFTNGANPMSGMKM